METTTISVISVTIGTRLEDSVDDCGVDKVALLESITFMKTTGCTTKYRERMLGLEETTFIAKVTGFGQMDVQWTTDDGIIENRTTGTMKTVPILFTMVMESGTTLSVVIGSASFAKE